MKKIVLIALCIFLSSCDHPKQVHFAVIPHHNLVRNEMQNFYRVLQQQFPEVQRIVLISPNHFARLQTNFVEFPSNGWYCFSKQPEDCVSGISLNLTGSDDYAHVFPRERNAFMVQDHGIGEHFSMIQKFFPQSSVAGILLKIDPNVTENLDNLLQKIQADTIPTLVVASVDFSHHVPDMIARFHDAKTNDFLAGNTPYNDLEVDCPNCLVAVKNMAHTYGQKSFHLYKRTSVDSVLRINSLYENTSHIFGYFSDEPAGDIFSPSDKSYIFPQPLPGKTPVYGILFGDAHFTRGFTDPKNTQDPLSYFACFFHHADSTHKPKFWHNRLLYGFDIAGINLETSLASSEECTLSSKETFLQTNPDNIHYFSDIGFNLFNLGNNHTHDCGDSGFMATQKNLDEKGLARVGSGNNTDTVLLKKFGDTNIAFISFNTIETTYDTDKILSQIRQSTDEGSVVIVQVHWGTEYASEANATQQTLAHEMVDAGAKMIVGHHPHTIQNTEIYKDVPIFYSLGNFIFDQPFPETLTGQAVIFRVTGSDISYESVLFDRDAKNLSIDCQSWR